MCWLATFPAMNREIFGRADFGIAEFSLDCTTRLYPPYVETIINMAALWPRWSSKSVLWGWWWKFLGLQITAHKRCSALSKGRPKADSRRADDYMIICWPVQHCRRADSRRADDYTIIWSQSHFEARAKLMIWWRRGSRLLWAPNQSENQADDLMTIFAQQSLSSSSIL